MDKLGNRVKDNKFTFLISYEEIIYKLERSWERKQILRIKN